MTAFLSSGLLSLFAFALQSPPPLPPASLPLETRDASAAAVVVNCRFEPTGELTDCKVISEEPEGFGYGDIALNGATRARLTPEQIARIPAGNRLQFTVGIHPPEDFQPAVNPGGGRR